MGSDKYKIEANGNYWESLAKILERYKRFQKRVVFARKQLGINSDGLPAQDRASWYSNSLNSSGLRKDNAHNFDLSLLPDDKKFMDVLERLASDFNLDSRWYSSLFQFIVGGGTLIPPFGKASVNARVNDVRLTKEELVVEQLWIDIRKDTSIEDIRELWGQVEAYQEYMATDFPKKRRPIQKESIEKYVKVRDLEDDKLPQKRIARDYPELGFTSAEDVSNFKKELEERFKPAKPGVYQKRKPLW
jgi:hypothetical protein